MSKKRTPRFARRHVFVFAIAAFAATGANAVPVHYSFQGVAPTGSSMSLGGGAIDLSGRSFTAFGHTLNDIDVYNGGAVGDGVGMFAATTTYSFGALGAFVTDVGAHFYFQDCSSLTAISCIGLATSDTTGGFRFDFAPPALGNPDLAPIAVGALAPTSWAFTPQPQTNALGHELSFGIELDGFLSSATVGVPEPATLGLVCLGFAALAFRRKWSAI